jgi:hypothetical protein
MGQSMGLKDLATANKNDNRSTPAVQPTIFGVKYLFKEPVYEDP